MSAKKADQETEIRKLIDDWRETMRRGDIDAIMSFYAPEIRLFDIIPPLEYKGRDEYRKIWEMCLPAFEGPIECEVRDLSISQRVTVWRSATDSTASPER